MTVAPEIIDAGRAAVSRLMQMGQHWQDAADSYFEPERFLLSLQGCITTSRTVTFIIQAHKNDVSGFDAWYAPHQAAVAADPIMGWAKEARNTIEKRGDLETHSQVRASIVASYLGGPFTDWMPQALFASAYDMYRAIPKKFLIPHVVENGTLLIERRWVDRDLPHMEVLEALAHVYVTLANIVTSFLGYIGLEVPPTVSESRPKEMTSLAMDRAIYLAMSDGARRGYRFFPRAVRPATSKDAEKLIARYGATASWKHLEAANTFKEVAEAFFKSARAVMARDGYHLSFAFFLKGSGVVRLIHTDFPDRAAKYVMIRDLAKLAIIDDADGVILLGEAWLASPKDAPSGFAADAPNRSEVLLMQAGNSKGETITIDALVIRRRFKRTKVKNIGGPRVLEGGFEFMLAPFQKEWGCLDEEKLAAAMKLQGEAGIKAPEVGSANELG